jgi:hypothetical protein
VYRVRRGLGPKRLLGNMFYKNHRDIVVKAANHFKKPSILLKMYLKSLAILEKAEKTKISLKKSLKNNWNF